MHLASSAGTGGELSTVEGRNSLQAIAARSPASRRAQAACGPSFFLEGGTFSVG